MTPLKAADGQIYAVGQGTVIAGGASAEGETASVVQGVPTSGSVPAGAHIEREIEFNFTQLKSIRLGLRTPDFTTAGKIEKAINAAYGRVVSRMLDSGTILIDIEATRAISPAHAISKIENIKVEPQRKARVVVDQPSGTIVIGEDVRISRVAVSQGNLTLRIREDPIAIQPNPFSRGQTIVVPRTTATLDEDPGIALAEVDESTSLSEVVAGLNALGVSPRDMIDILKSIKAAGALHAEFIVQ
jgi:flagellar P-ring protein precursor FlgI